MVQPKANEAAMARALEAVKHAREREISLPFRARVKRNELRGRDTRRAQLLFGLAGNEVEEAHRTSKKV